MKMNSRTKASKLYWMRASAWMCLLITLDNRNLPVTDDQLTDKLLLQIISIEGVIAEEQTSQLCESDGKAPPIIDIDPLFGPSGAEEHSKVIQEIGDACVKWGFFQVINHHLDRAVMKRTQDEMKRFFHLPVEEKLKVKRTANNSRGYANDELTKQKRDWKEIFDFGHVYRIDIDESHPDNSGLDGQNQWPEHSPEFKRTMKEYYEANVKLGFVLMDALSESLGADKKFFREAFDNHTSFARLNYYPTLTSSKAKEGSLGISRHTDAGGLTILWQDGKGLQVYSGSKQDNNDGEWVDMIPLSDDAFTINIGDMFHVWTGGKCAAPEHRVLANREKERFSIPFFYNPSYDVVVQPIPGLKGSKQKYRPFTWGQFRRARFAGDYADLGTETQIEDWEIRE